MEAIGRLVQQRGDERHEQLDADEEDGDEGEEGEEEREAGERQNVIEDGADGTEDEQHCQEGEEAVVVVLVEDEARRRRRHVQLRHERVAEQRPEREDGEVGEHHQRGALHAPEADALVGRRHVHVSTKYALGCLTRRQSKWLVNLPDHPFKSSRQS